MLNLIRHWFLKAVVIFVVGFLGLLGFRYWENNQPVETASPSSSEIIHVEMDCWTTARGCSVGVVDNSVPPVPPEAVEKRVGVEDVNRRICIGMSCIL